jgi:heterogeneous nuclear ribonucleoprotein R
MSSDRQEPEELLDLEGDDDIMDDDDGYRRNRRRDDSEEPEEYEENDDRQAEADGDGRGEDDTEIAADGEEQGAEGDGGPEDAEEKKKWDELLALPPHGSEVFIGGLPRDTTEEDLRELCEPLGEIYEVCLLSELSVSVQSLARLRNM